MIIPYYQDVVNIQKNDGEFVVVASIIEIWIFNALKEANLLEESVDFVVLSTGGLEKAI